MVQNILALVIVFAAAIISVYAIIKSLISKNSTGCDGCSACEVKYESIDKRHHLFSKKDFRDLKISQGNI